MPGMFCSPSDKVAPSIMDRGRKLEQVFSAIFIAEVVFSPLIELYRVDREISNKLLSRMLYVV